MKHIVNVAFDFDDERVSKILSETVEQKVIADIKQDVINKIFDSGWNYKPDPKTSQLREWVKAMVKDILDEVKEDICDKAAKEVADRLVRSAKFREKVAEKVSEA